MLLQLPFDFPVKVLELGIAVRMVCPFQRLAVGLQTVPQIVKQSSHLLVAGLVPQSPQFVG